MSISSGLAPKSLFQLKIKEIVKEYIIYMWPLAFSIINIVVTVIISNIKYTGYGDVFLLHYNDVFIHQIIKMT